MKELFLQVLYTSVLGSILISIIMITNNKLLTKYSYTLNYFLSIIVIIRMLFIAKIEINMPILNKIFTNKEGINNLNYYLFKASTDSKLTFDYINIISIVWLIGAVIIIIYYAYFQFIFYFKLTSNIQTNRNNNLQKLLNNQVRAKGISKNIKVNVVNGIPSPLIIGILKNTIVIPSNNYTEKELKFIFNHEITHIKRKDNLLKLLMIFALALHWFNPFVYILRKFFYEQCELSCDEQVIKNIEIMEVKEYALLLLNSIKYKNNLRISAMSSELTSKKINITKRRIESMLNLKTKKKGTLIATMSLLVIGGTIFANSTAFADTQQDNGIENYTFIESPENAKEIPNRDNISAVTLYSDSVEVEYTDGTKQVFSNSDYSLNLKAAE
ncbi:M56 family metallopeptidase [Clostridium sp.]|uniref:M56 family metallopeptidase n=1 Tax=Clostridium sp. TaxID=1506 RepID=UPI0035206563